MIKRKLSKLLKWTIIKFAPNLTRHINKTSNGLRELPRPATKFMKDYFKNKSITGVELGVANGNNSMSFLETLNIQKLYLVDIWEKFEEKYQFAKLDNMKLYNPILLLTQKQINDVEKRGRFGSYESVKKRFEHYERENQVEIIRSESKNASLKFDDNSLDFIYIDANHDFTHVIEDLSNWYPKIKKNGIIAGHDSHLIDVIQAWINFCYDHDELLSVRFPDVYFVKKDSK